MSKSALYRLTLFAIAGTGLAFAGFSALARSPEAATAEAQAPRDHSVLIQYDGGRVVNVWVLKNPSVSIGVATYSFNTATGTQVSLSIPGSVLLGALTAAEARAYHEYHAPLSSRPYEDTYPSRAGGLRGR